jgi:hemin uptake protein HemP
MTDDPIRQPDRVKTGEQEVEAAEAVVQAQELFRGQKEICIEHEGVRYRLRITRRNKLILQK